MLAYDFEYDGIRLSDLGYTMCTFGSKGTETNSNGSEVTFNTTSIYNGTKFELASSEYDSYLTATFQICKNQCDSEGLEITVPEFRYLMRWLNRKHFHKFKLLSNEYWGFYFEGSFNLSRIEEDDRIIGAELSLTTNRPFGLMEPRTIKIENTESGGEHVVNDISDEEGQIFPVTEITLASGGDLEIYNELEDRTTIIANCSDGEVITMDSPIITTSDESHKIQNDFNWNFISLSNIFHDRDNKFTISLPCTIKLTYSPVAKMGL